MTHTKLRRALNKLASEAESEIPSLNCGGCGVFALKVGERLAAAGFPVCYAMASYESHDLDAARAALAGNGENPALTENWGGMTHVAVQYRFGNYERIYETCAGVQKADATEIMGYPLHRGRLTHDELEALVGCRGNWNSWFDRDEYAPEIERLIAKHLDFLPA